MFVTCELGTLKPVAVMERAFVVVVVVGKEELKSVAVVVVVVVVLGENVVKVVGVADIMVLDDVIVDVEVVVVVLVAVLVLYDVEVNVCVLLVVDSADVFAVEKIAFAENPVAVVCLEKFNGVSVAFSSLKCRVIPKFTILQANF